MKYLLLILLLPSILSAASIDLSWTDNSSNEEGFQIERKNPGSEFSIIGTVGIDVTKFTDETKPGTYEYRVRAFNSFGYSGYTNEIKTSAGDSPSPDPVGLEGPKPVLIIIPNEDGSITVKPIIQP